MQRDKRRRPQKSLAAVSLSESVKPNRHCKIPLSALSLIWCGARVTEAAATGAVVISYTFYFMRSTFKCYTISSNQTFKSYTISIRCQFNFQMLYIHTDVIPFLLINHHKLYLNVKSSFKSHTETKLEKRLSGFHYKNLLQLT